MTPTQNPKGDNEMSNYEKIVVAGDFHYPFQDDKAVDVFLKFVKQEQPNCIIINGDLADFWEISKYDRVPRTGVRFDEELKMVHEFFARLRKACPAAKIDLIEGNHEFRFKSYLIRKAPELYGLGRLTLEDLFECHQYHVRYHPLKEGQSRFGDNAIKVGKLYVGHWNKVSKHAGYTVKNLIDDKGVSLTQGHTHRVGQHTRRLFDGSIVGGWEIGCLCDLNPSYMSMPNWQHGFAVVYLKRETGRFHVYPILMIDYEFIWNGKSFK